MAKQTFTTGQVLTAAQMTSLQQTAMLGGDASVKVASYTLVAADAGTTVAMNSASSTTITVNTGLFAAGDTVFIQNRGAGVCTVTAGSATVASAGSLALPQNDAGILYFTSASAATFYDFIQVGATSPLTTKGDLYGFSTSDQRIPIGANGTILTADSTESLGLKWAAAASGGKVLQVVSATFSTSTSNSTSTYVDTGLSASITPSSATSKILCMYYHPIRRSSGSANNKVSIRLVRASTTIHTSPDLLYTDVLAAHEADHSTHLSFVDSPATTSATTYKTTFANVAGTASVTVQVDSRTASLILMEIGA